MRGWKTISIGLMISALALGGFVLLASVFQQDAFLQSDLGFTQRIHASEESPVAPFLDIISDMGKSVLILLVVQIAIYLYMRRRWSDLVFWLATISLGFVLNRVLREVFQGPRPYLEDIAIIQQNTGFPSGHAMMSLITYGLLAYGVRDLLPRRWWLLTLGALILLVLLIGYSRMVFGVHYFSDIVGGYAIGLFWLALCLSLRTFMRAWMRTDQGTNIGNRVGNA
jgi:membrane-associated phospholipid phosphatase